MNIEECPFKVGQTVIYHPTERGLDLVVMTDFNTLQRGAKYKVARIDKGCYVVPEGFEQAGGGGLYWTEFRPED